MELIILSCAIALYSGAVVGLVALVLLIAESIANRRVAAAVRAHTLAVRTGHPAGRAQRDTWQ